MSRKPILCLDFDGVLHSYSSGWKGVGNIPDPPVHGAEEFLYEATKHFRVMIYSSRSKSLAGRWAMKAWVREHFDLPLTFDATHNADFLYEEVEWPWFKPSAMVTIDDRALTFDGTWPTISALQGFQPWNKKAVSAQFHGRGCLLCSDMPKGEWCRACGFSDTAFQQALSRRTTEGRSGLKDDKPPPTNMDTSGQSGGEG